MCFVRKYKRECDFYFTGQSSTIANEDISAEDNIVTLEKHEENPLTEDIKS